MSGFDAPMFREKSTKQKANKTEKKVAKSLGLKQQPNSGAGDWRKGDFLKSAPADLSNKFKGRKFVGDAKSTKHASLSVSLDMIQKIRQDMHEENGDEWFIPIILKGRLEGVVISPELFREITGED